MWGEGARLYGDDELTGARGGGGGDLAGMGDDELVGVGEKELASGGQMRAGKRRDRDKLMARGLGETEWHGTKKIHTPVAYSESSANWVPNAESSAYSVAYYENFLDEGTHRAAF